MPPTAGSLTSRTVFDVRVKVDEQPRREPMWIEYADFGERFVTYAVTEERITAAVSGMTGRGVKIGPFSSAPPVWPVSSPRAPWEPLPSPVLPVTR